MKNIGENLKRTRDNEREDKLKKKKTLKTPFRKKKRKSTRKN